MKILLTSDWQCCLNNLERCERVVADILAAVKKTGCEAVLHLGDVKDALNPVDQRVTNFLVSATQEIVSTGVFFGVLIGNHDRAGMGDDTQDIGPVLRAAGATVFDKAGFFNWKGIQFWHIPFFRDKGRTSRELTLNHETLALKAAAQKTILLFHDTVLGSSLNLQRKSDAGIVLPKPEPYLAAFGGHVHFHQQLAPHAWYVGSPFPQDWGEANQRKGYLTAEVNSGKLKVNFLPSSLPSYYDPDIPQFRKPLRGSYVRLRVPYKTKEDLPTKLKAAERKLLRQYPGVIPTLVPVRETYGIDTELEAPPDNDTALVHQYLLRNPVGGIREEAEALLLHALQGRTGSSRGLLLRHVQAKNYLSFTDCELEIDKGLTLVTGRNEDWNSCSNGSGKSSFLSLPSVALFGRTTKDQRNDAWRQQTATGEYSADTSAVSLRATLPDGRDLSVYRSRNPAKLETALDGKDVTMGSVADTQRWIEEVTGLSWEVLLNGLYIEQKEINLLVRGTDKQRKELFASFLGLERFSLALDYVKRERKRVDKQALEAEEDIQAARRALVQNRATREDLKGTADWVGARRLYQTEKTRLKKYENGKADRDAVAERNAALEAQLDSGQEAIDQADEDVWATQQEIKRVVKGIQNFARAKVCPTCGQTIKAASSRVHKAELQKQREQLQRRLAQQQKKKYAVEDKLKPLGEELQRNRAILEEWETKYAEIKRAVADRKRDLDYAEKVRGLEKQYRREATVLRKRLLCHKAYIAVLEEDRIFLDGCIQALGRDGIPAYLVACTCPRLNESAAFYSDLFSGGTIQVEFAVVDENIDVQVSNANGGAVLGDQSAGELRITSLIAAFSLRDALTGYNVLVLDEPGEGLDSQNAKAFALGLNKLTERFPSIYLTTHNPTILATIEPTRTLQIVKRNRVSTLVEAS